nr:hypothetical protein [Streptomyces sp. AVP053U2]
MATRVRVRDSKKSRSAGGTPSSEEITRDGTGSAKSLMRSAWSPAESIASMRSSTVRSIAGRSSRTRRTVNSGMSTLRNRSCSGESRPTNQPGIWSCLGTPIVSPTLGKPSLSGLALILGWVSTVRTSSCRVTSQIGTPFGRWDSTRPFCSRWLAYWDRGSGSSGVRRGKPTTVGSVPVVMSVPSSSS